MSFIRGFSVNTGLTLATLSLGMLNSVVLANSLGRADFGVYKLWTAFVMVCVLSLGEWISKGNTYAVGKQRAVAQATRITLIYSIGLATALAVSIPITLKPASALLPNMSLLSWILLLGIVALMVCQKANLGILLGEQRLIFFGILPLGFVVIFLLSNVLVSYLAEINLQNVLWTWTAAAGIIACWSLWVALRLPSIAHYPSAWRDIFHYGVRGQAVLVVIYLLFRADLFLVDHFLGREAVGVYSVASIFAEMMQRIPNIASVVLLSLVVRGDDEPNLIIAVAHGAIAFSVLFAAFISVTGTFWLETLFPQYTDAFVPLLWLLPGLVFSGVGAIFNAKLMGSGYPAVAIWAPCVALVANIGLNILLIPTLGLRGAALSTTISYCIWATVVTAYYVVSNRISPTTFFDIRHVPNLIRSKSTTPIP